MLIAKAEPPGLLRVASWIGRRMDVHCTGVGKALIAFLPEEELDYLIREHGLLRHNEKTNTSSRRLREEFSKVRRLGYAFDDEEDEIGLRCIGAPVFEQVGKVVASVSVAGTVRQIHPQNRRLIAEQVQQTASRISHELGFGHDD